MEVYEWAADPRRGLWKWKGPRDWRRPGVCV